MPLETIVVGDENLFDVIIIGAGPGGLIAGTELAKMNYLVAIIERDVPGGKIVKINNIRNFSESEGIVGSELATKYYNEYTKTNGRYIFGNIVNITKKLGYIAIYSSEGQTWFCKACLIATGTQNIKMNVTNEDKYFQMGVSYCINCDGKLAKDKNVLVVGDNKLAIAGAIFLSKKCECKSVGLICQTQFNNDSLSLIKDLPIKTYEQCQVIQVNGGSYNVVGITANYQNKVIDIPTDYIFVELGTIPATSFVQDLDIIDPIKKTINVNDKYQTTTSGLFAIGDVIRTHEQSVQNAVTDARIVAKSIDHYIKNEFKLPTK